MPSLEAVFLSDDRRVGQQGKDALGVKLARRCMPGENSCRLFSWMLILLASVALKNRGKFLKMWKTDVHDQIQTTFKDSLHISNKKHHHLSSIWVMQVGKHKAPAARVGL